MTSAISWVGDDDTLKVKFDRYDIINRHSISLLLAVFILSSIIIQHTSVSKIISFILVVLAYTIVFGLFLYGSDRIIRTERIYIILFSLLAFFIMVSTVSNLTIGSAFRLAVFLVFTSANIFIIPKVIGFDEFLYILSRITAVLVIIGFVPYVGGPAAIGAIDLSLWGGRLYWHPSLNPITSVFVGPNWLGFLTLIGSLSAAGEWWRTNTKFSNVLFVINVFGLSFTNYRTGWIAFVCAIGIFIAYIWFNRKIIVLLTVGGIAATGVALSMMFKIIPGPVALTELSLNGRKGSWVVGVQVLLERPLWGYGFGNTAEAVNNYVPPGSPANVHNSYLRAFLGMGIGGGITYLALFLITMYRSTLQAVSRPTVLLAGYLVAFFIVQIFNSLTFIGISLHSSMIAIAMGYHISK